MATATTIESTAKTMSVNSTFTTVAQNADRPSQGRALGTDRPSSASCSPKKCRNGRYSRYRAPASFTSATFIM